ncbi:methyltransferase, partial [Micromonospora sp. CPCC 206060]|uniref:methyltransferase n=1 Tax=Micromonospora sp. CPCC 206060 TaxID=3122406 RepID=UPI002FF12244
PNSSPAVPGYPPAQRPPDQSPVVDVGGGNGTLISAILKSSPESRGIVFDSPTGVEKAAQVLADEGVADRCDVHSGDFFVEVPRGGDAYVMKSIIHDWSDEQSMVILRNCREAVPADGRLLIIDPVLPPPPVTESLASPFAYLNDLAMLVKLGGKERTEAEYEALLSAAGFRKTRVVPLAGPARICLIEAVPVP